MGLFKSITKGISSFFGAPKAKSKVQQLPTWSPEQQEVFKTLAPLVKQGLSGPAPTAPQMYAPTTPEEEQYFNWAKSEAVRRMATGELPYEVGPEWAERYFEEGLRPVYEREWERNILPAIKEAYAGPGYYSTARGDEISQAALDFGLQLAKQKQELLYGEEKARRQAIEQAMGRIPAGQQVAATAAQYSRAIETEKIMDALQRYLMGESVEGQYNPAYNPMLQVAFALLGLQPYTYGVTTQQSGGGLGYGLLSGLAGGVGQGFGGVFGKYLGTKLF